MSYNRAKSSNEPLSVEKLTEELNKCVESQTTMKEVNAYWRKTGTCMGTPGITEAQAKKLDEKIAATRYSWEKQPYSTYDLTNNNSKIKRLQQSLAEASRGFEGWEFNGGRAEANTEMNRLQLFFDERPNDNQRALLKASGFKWARHKTRGSGSLPITPSTRLDFIKPSDGRTVREHQPKAPSRDTGER